MEDIWFEEELLPAQHVLEETSKSLAKELNIGKGQIYSEVKENAQGKVFIQKPRYEKLVGENKPRLSKSDSDVYLIRLGFEFAVEHRAYENGARFSYACCKAFLRSNLAGQPQPRVFDVLPANLYEGEPRKVTIKIGPELTIGDYGGSLGELSTDVVIGRVIPAVVGWTGQEERSPYWELRPITKELYGIQHLWIVLELPSGCEAVRLTPLVEADIRTKWGPITVGPNETVLEKRKSSIIPSPQV